MGVGERLPVGPTKIRTISNLPLPLVGRLCLGSVVALRCHSPPFPIPSESRGASTSTSTDPQTLDPPAMSARGVRPGVLHHKENNPADAQPGKRQRTAAGAGRQPLAAAPPPQEEPMVFSGREDVDALLNEKMKGKNKMDYKVAPPSLSPVSGSYAYLTVAYSCIPPASILVDDSIQARQVA